MISPVLPLTEEQDRNYESNNSTCVGCIFTLLSDQLYDIHMHTLWLVIYGRSLTKNIHNQMLDVNFMLMTSTMTTRWLMTVLSWNGLMKT